MLSQYTLRKAATEQKKKKRGRKKPCKIKKGKKEKLKKKKDNIIKEKEIRATVIIKAPHTTLAQRTLGIAFAEVSDGWCSN